MKSNLTLALLGADDQFVYEVPEDELIELGNQAHGEGGRFATADLVQQSKALDAALVTMEARLEAHERGTREVATGGTDRQLRNSIKDAWGALEALKHEAQEARLSLEEGPDYDANPEMAKDRLDRAHGILERPEVHRYLAPFGLGSTVRTRHDPDRQGLVVSGPKKSQGMWWWQLKEPDGTRGNHPEDDLEPTGVPDRYDFGDVISLPDISDVSFPTLIGALKPTKPPKRPPTGKKRRSVHWKGITLGRTPTPFEAAVLSLHDIVGRFGLANEQLVLALTQTREQALQSALTLDDARVAPVQDETGPCLRQAQLDMARYGAFEVRRELRRQGAVIPEPDPEDFTATVLAEPLLEWSVNLTADSLNKSWAADLQRHALRLQRAKRGKHLKADWGAAATASIGYGLKGAVRKLLHESFAAGRRLEVVRLSALYRQGVVTRPFNLGNQEHGKGGKFAAKGEGGTYVSGDNVEKYGTSDSPKHTVVTKTSQDGMFQKGDVLVNNDAGQIKLKPVGPPNDPDDPGYLFVENVEVDEKYRGKGYGSDLYRRAFRVAKKLGYNGVMTEAGRHREEDGDAVWDNLRERHTVIEDENDEDIEYLVDLKPPKRSSAEEAHIQEVRARFKAIAERDKKKLSTLGELNQWLHLADVDDDEAEQLVDYVIQTAVMDNATCDPCAAVDGSIWDYDDDEQQQAEPPYYLCEGGDNCRCVQVYVLKTGGSWVVRGGEIVDE